MIGSNTRDYKQDTGEKLYRRSMYTFWKRAAPPASMDIFNAPTRETCTVRRERTNTPLASARDAERPQFVEAARHLAQTDAAIERREATEAGSIVLRRATARAAVPCRKRWQSSAGSLDELLASLRSRSRRREEADRRRRIEGRRRSSTPRRWPRGRWWRMS